MKRVVFGLLVGLSSVGCKQTKAEGSAAATGSTAVTSAAPAAAALETVPARCTPGSGGIKGNGSITRTARSAKGFRDVSVNVVGTIVVQEGPAFDVQVETDANVQDSITVEAKADVLVIGANGNHCTNKLRVIVTLPAFHGAMLQGSGDIDVTKQSAASDVALTSNGSGSIKFRGAVAALTVGVNGSGSVMLDRGSATATKVSLNGSGSVRKGTFEAGAVTKSVNGSGSVSL